MAIKIEIFIALTPEGFIYFKMAGANTKDAGKSELATLELLKPVVEGAVLDKLKQSGYRVAADYLQPSGKSH
ncbi:hypothetical protein [Klebsiella grimontii]|uniref:hypothetical protein n=1 Tax=Klebsiella grimontii TaxID=2058152 RepID=UPI001D85FDCF|nr:hypothetical protein [Klebsiella grimontii]EGT0066773.1 hypothetical protein [Klebsiella michiganensis]WDI68761.1 hypothetical protein PU992_20795 [Klebsiella grimontii]